MAERERRAENAALQKIHVRATKLLGMGGHTLTDEEAAELDAMRARAAQMLEERGLLGKDADPGDQYVPYPAIADPAFGEKLAAKREFREHVYPAPSEKHGLDALWQQSCSAGSFELTPSQLFVRNYLSPATPYNGLLLFHGVGSGKTCSAVTIAEQFDGMRNGVLVIMPPGLRDGFARNIYDPNKVPARPDGTLDFEAPVQCTGSKYPDMVREKGALSREQLGARVARLVRGKYRFMGPGVFANVVQALEGTPDKLRRRFSDTLIIVDEAHHLRGEESGKRAAPALRRVLAACEGVKLLLLTATPMFNAPSDVLDLLNLLRINDRLPTLSAREVFAPAANGGALTAQGRKRLLLAAQGYVSYMRGDSPFSFPLRLQPSVNSDPAVLRPAKYPALDIKGRPIPAAEKLSGRLELVGSALGQAQRGSYRALMDELVSADDDVLDGAVDGAVNEEDGPRAALYSALQLANVTFPGSGPGQGRAGFESAFLAVKKGGGAGKGGTQFRYRPGVPPFLSPALIPRYAPKIATLVDRIMRSEGVVMVYSRFNWSGLVPVAMALEHRGLSRFDAPALLQQNPQLGGGHAAGGGRYAIISGLQDIASSQAAAEDALRSAANKDGGVIKVVLLSDKGSEGLDLRYIREVHVLEPWFHLNKVEQVVGRAARQCSHASLPLAKRNVTTYLHVVTPGEEGGKARETIDLRAYRLAELKQARIKEVEWLLRDHAVDCFSNRERLHFDKDKLGLRADLSTSQGTLVRGYRIGDAPDAAPRCRTSRTQGPVDETTYNPALHNYHGASARRLIAAFYAQPGAVRATFEQLWSFVSSRSQTRLRTEQLAIELQRMLDYPVQLINSHGQAGRLTYRGGSYMFHPSDVDSLAALSDRERDADARAALNRAPARVWVTPHNGAPPGEGQPQ